MPGWNIVTKSRCVRYGRAASSFPCRLAAVHACGWRRIDAPAALAPHYAEPLDAAEVLSLLDAALQAGPLALDVDQAGERQHYHGSVERLSVSEQWVFRLGATPHAPPKRRSTAPRSCTPRPVCAGQLGRAV